MKATPSPRSPPSAPAIAEEALSLIEVDYEVLPHVIDVDEAMEPDAPLLFDRHDHARHRARADQAIQHLEAARIHDRRPRCRLCASRRGDREGVQDRGRASGATSSRTPASRVAMPTARPRSGPPARATSRCARSPRRSSACKIGDLRVYAGGDRRRLRRQDGDLSGTCCDAAVAQEVRPAGAPA